MFLNPDLKLGFMLPIIYLFGFATAITWTTAMQSFKDIPSFEFLPLWKTWIFHPMAKAHGNTWSNNQKLREFY